MGIKGEFAELGDILKDIQKELMVLTGKARDPLIEAHELVVSELKNQIAAKDQEIELINNNVLYLEEQLDAYSSPQAK
jgi:hypothetical protein